MRSRFSHGPRRAFKIYFELKWSGLKRGSLCIHDIIRPVIALNIIMVVERFALEPFAMN